jgi:hypothetical protein
MTEDAEWLRTAPQLREQGFRQQGHDWISETNSSALRYVPLYEAKMAHQFDHRWATYDVTGTFSRGVTQSEKLDHSFEPLPRYWVPEDEVNACLTSRQWNYGWLLGWRKIAPATNERTLIVSILPRVGAGDSLCFIYPKNSPARMVGLCANLNSLICDYIVR